MLFKLRPLQWNKSEHESWTAQGIVYFYTIRKEHKKLRLMCSTMSDRQELYDFDDYYDAMIYAEKHHAESIRKYIKEVTHEHSETSSNI